MYALLERAQELLDQSRFERTRTREAVEQAIQIIEDLQPDKKYRFYLGQRGLVHFPDLLERFLRVRQEIDLDDYESMVARCIEFKEGEDLSLKQQSLTILLKYYHPGATLRLLPGRYQIRQELYEQAKERGVRDLYYEGSTEPYTLKSPEEMDREYLYGGYRVAYHLLLYGGSRKKELVSWWKIAGYDCTYDAACDYYETTDQKKILKYISAD